MRLMVSDTAELMRFSTVNVGAQCPLGLRMNMLGGHLASSSSRPCFHEEAFSDRTESGAPPKNVLPSMTTIVMPLGPTI